MTEQLPAAAGGGGMRLAVVVSFLDEAAYLGRLLASIERQTEPPDALLLIDDGSADRSAEIAEQFAADHPFARALRRPRRPAQRDRLVSAPELRAFQWGVEQLDGDGAIIAKMDGDLDLAPSLFGDVRAAFAAEPRLGITGSYLWTDAADGGLRREQHPEYHVRGPNKFYRRECLEAISPLPAILGWDTIDDLQARRAGWTTRSFEVTEGRTIHLRPTGSHGGRLRAFRRWGWCAWGYGAHPLWVLLGAIRRAAQPPLLLGGVNYLLGWCIAAVRRYPRAEPGLRAFTRTEELGRISRRLRALRAGVR